MKKKLLAIVLVLALSISLVPFSNAGTVSDLTAGSVSNWGGHNFVGDTETVKTTVTPNADGSVSAEGTTVHDAIGVTYTKPVYLSNQGFSMQFSFDKYDTSSTDKWFAVYLSDKETFTDSSNASPVFGQMATDTYTASKGRGLVMMMRPDGDGNLRIGLYYYGVKSASDATATDGQWIYAGNGCYDNIKLNSGSYQNIRLSLVKRPEGGYNIIFNNGAFTRNGSDRISDENGINPAQKFTFLDQIFPQGTKAYIKMTAYNQSDYDTAFSVSEIDGSYANLANTLDSWGSHTFVTAEGSAVNNTVAATDNGEVKVTGSQSAGNGEVGVTYARPVDMTQGFSIQFSLDKFLVNGQNGTDSWFALQLTDKETITDGRNASPVFRRFEAGDPTYGSGLVMLVRPLGNNVLSIGEIYWNGVKIADDGTVTKTSNFQGDSNGCYSYVKLASYDKIKFAFVARASGGYDIVVNDGVYDRCDASGNVMDRVSGDGGAINPNNKYPNLAKVFPDGTPAYVALSYHDNANGGSATQFRISAFDGQQAAPNTPASWGAHNYAASDGSAVVSNTAADENGGLTVSGYQTAGGGGVGVTLARPVDVADGFSIDFSLDKYETNPGTDCWFALQILNKGTITDAQNTTAVFRRFEPGSSAYGSGLVMLMRPMANNTLDIGGIYWNGVKFDADNNPTITDGAFDSDANGCYSQIKLDSFSDIKVAFVPRSAGGFDIVFNDGNFTRVGSDRASDDNGCINIANKYVKLAKMFPYGTDAYVNLAYKGGGTPIQFTVKKISDVSAATVEKDVPAVNGTYQLFGDTKYAKGFYVSALQSADEGSHTPTLFTYGQSGVTPVWEIAQWDSKYDFNDTENDAIFTSPADNVYKYFDPSKAVTVNTDTGDLKLRLNASAVYGSTPRVAGQAWPHLLVQEPLANSSYNFAYKLKNVSQLRLQLNEKLTYYKDCMDGKADPSLHAASFYIYLYLKGINSKGQAEQTWFGLPLFDNRYTYCAEYGSVDGGKADASGLFIYTLPSKAFTTSKFTDANGGITGSDSNSWGNVDVNLMPYVQRALTLAQQSGFMQGVTLDTCYLDGMNMGWEMTGTYDAEMEVKDLSLQSYVGTNYTEGGNGIKNIPVSTMGDTESFSSDGSLTMTVPKGVVEKDGINDSILTAVEKKNSDALTLSGVKGKVVDSYLADLLVDGSSYIYNFDKSVTLAYKIPDSVLSSTGSVDNLKFYTSDGEQLTPSSYDASTHKETFALKKLSSFEVVDVTKTATTGGDTTVNNTGDSTGTNGTNNNVDTGGTGLPALIIGLAVLSGGTLLALRKKRKSQLSK